MTSERTTAQLPHMTRKPVQLAVMFTSTVRLIFSFINVLPIWQVTENLLSDCPFMWYQNIGSMFFHCHKARVWRCNRETDGRTDGQNYDSQDRAGIVASCGKNATNPFATGVPPCTSQGKLRSPDAFAHSGSLGLGVDLTHSYCNFDMTPLWLVLHFLTFFVFLG